MRKSLMPRNQTTSEVVGPYNYHWNPNKPGHSREMGSGRLDVSEALLNSFIFSTVVVTSPDIPEVGEVIETGDTVSITWSRHRYTDTIRLELFDGQGYHSTIASAVSGTSYSWVVPSNIVTGHDYRIKVHGNSSNETFDYSDRAHTIKGVSLVNIPDPNFLAALIDLGLDTDGDGQINELEAAVVDSMDISSRAITDLTGFELFIGINHLDVSNNLLTDLGPILANEAYLDETNCTKTIDFSNNILRHDYCELSCNCWSSFAPNITSCWWCP